MKNKKVFISVIGLILFIALSTGISYGYYVYNKEIASIELSSGNIGINFQTTNNTSSVISNQPLSDALGKTWPSYLEFTVNGTVDEEAILYELEIIKNNNSTLDNQYVKVYLTKYDTTNSVEVPLMSPMRYSELYDSLANNGKGMYQELISSNNGQSINVSHKYRLRVWISDDYTDSQSKVFNYAVYMYATNVNASNYRQVTFTFNDGRDVGISKYVEDGSNYGSMPNLSPNLGQFYGFYTSLTEGTEVTSETRFNIGTSATTLYASVLVQAELLAKDYATKAYFNAENYSEGPYQGSINDGKIIYYVNNDEANMKNYVWYSGKLWRITAIYPDGKIKLVTENPMTAIMPSSVSWNSSYIKTWLEEEFLPTLYNKKNIIVTNAKWNVKETSDATTNPYPTNNNSDIAIEAIGLLNAYEYTKSYTSSDSNSYLQIGQYWWLMNSQTSSSVWCVYSSGSAGSKGVSNAYGVRPSIYLQSNVVFASGEGTRNNPYMIKGDKSVATNNDLTSRTNGINGEYVKFNNEVYRIIGREGTTTKIVKADYIRNGNTVLTKKLSSDVYYDTSSADNTYWDNYLVNDWYNDIATSPINYKGMIATNTDPEAQGELSGKYYKRIFTEGSYQNVLSTNASEYYYSKVGLLRYGEMFATQLSLGTHINNMSSYSPMWLLTPNSSYVWYVNYSGNAFSISVSLASGVRPTINLKSTVKVTCNSGEMGTACDGTYFRPYDLTTGS